MDGDSRARRETSVDWAGGGGSGSESTLASSRDCIVTVFPWREFPFVARVVSPTMSKLNQPASADNSMFSRGQVGYLDRAPAG